MIHLTNMKQTQKIIIKIITLIQVMSQQAEKIKKKINF